MFVAWMMTACATASSSGADTTPSDATFAQWSTPIERAERNRGAAQPWAALPESTAREARRALRSPVEERRIDVSLHGAPLSDALTLLAEEAGLDIVIEDALPDPVTLRLRSVRPGEALEALASAYGVTLSTVAGTVVARRSH